MEGWRKVFIGGEDGEAFLASQHSEQGCIGCHQGQDGIHTKEDAHLGLIDDPSDGVTNSCSGCHGTQASTYPNSVHATQAGYIKLIEDRANIVFSEHPEVMQGFESNCASCHASCGDCHISQPKNVGGGLVRAHSIQRTPDMTRNCTACHGSRVGDEYRGLNEYAGWDVHYVPGGKNCVDCHAAKEMHGDGSRPDYRYAVGNMTQCTDCHPGLEGANAYHSQHMTDLSCQVCHSQTYKSCNSCHVGEGITGTSYATFKIGHNPIPELREAKYTLLRHIPVSSDTYAGWGLTDLEEFDSVPTWKYASPHNIRRWTARTEAIEGRTCFESCHTSEDWYLRASDLAAMPLDEQAANAHLVVPDGSPETW